MTAIDQRYALRDLDERIDGEGLTWWLHLPNLGGSAPYIGEHPLERAVERNWWRVPEWVPFDIASAAVELVGQPRQEVVGYRRTLDTPDYPETMTVEDFSRVTDPDEEAYDHRVRALYEAVYESRPAARTAVEGPWIVLDGAPPPDDGLTWVADLPFALRHRPEYLHLFPGRLDGFREAVAAVLNGLDGVEAYARSDRRHLTVSVSVDVPRPTRVEWSQTFDPTIYSTVRERKRARLRFDAPTTAIVHRLEVPVPICAAPTRALAVELWNEWLEDIAATISALRARTCPTCHGNGWVEEKPRV